MLSKLNTFLRIFIIMISLVMLHGMMACGNNSANLDATTDVTAPESDFDGDGIINSEDDDDDNDGVLDVNDAFPFDPDESSDFDGDGIGDNADTDADGDGVTDETDCDDMDATINPEAEDLPDPEYQDTNCDGVDGNASLAVWVSKSEGSDSNNGTIDEPVKTIAKGIELASDLEDQDRMVFVVMGNYQEDVVVTDDVSLYGGYGSLENNIRSRNINTNLTSILGKDADGSITLPFPGGDMALEYTMLIQNSNSVINGFAIEGDLFGIAVLSVDSNLTFSYNTVSDDTDITTPREVNIGIAALLNDNSTTSYTVTVSNNEFIMTGNDDITTGLEFGAMAIPTDNAEGSLNFIVNDNEFNFTGTIESVGAIYAADGDTDMTDSASSDGFANISLVAQRNDIHLLGESYIATGIAAGYFPGGSFDDWKFAGQATIDSNYIELTGNEAGIGISTNLIRQESDITNNIINIYGSDIEYIGFYNGFATTNFINNTVVIEDDNGGGGAGIFYTYDESETAFVGYLENSPGQVINNIISITSTGTPSCESYGIIEQVDATTDSYVNTASPTHVQNNNLYMNTDCTYEYVYRTKIAVSSPSVEDIENITDLNNKTGFKSDDPSEISGNISESPDFTDDFMLSNGSPCIDTGLETDIITADFLGSARPLGDAYDMGAYEQ